MNRAQIRAVRRELIDHPGRTLADLATAVGVPPAAVEALLAEWARPCGLWLPRVGEEAGRWRWLGLRAAPAATPTSPTVHPQLDAHRALLLAELARWSDASEQLRRADPPERGRRRIGAAERRGPERREVLRALAAAVLRGETPAEVRAAGRATAAELVARRNAATPPQLGPTPQHHRAPGHLHGLVDRLAGRLEAIAAGRSPGRLPPEVVFLR
jgi:hypothetical protein